MEQVVERVNALAALKRVKQNKGGPGVDGMIVEELPPYLVTHWEGIREQLLSGTTTVYRELRARQVPDDSARGAAAHARRWWATAAHRSLQTALPNSYFDRLGVPRLTGP